MATTACVRCAQQQQQQHGAHAQQQRRNNNFRRILHIYCAWASITLLAASVAMVNIAFPML